MAKEAARRAFKRGCAYVEASARPLDVARLRHRLGRGGTGAVVAALGPFQNADGGFGHGLEPDIPSPASSAIATSVAFQALRGAGAPADEPMVRRGLQWLEAAFDWDRGVWPIIGPDVDLAPHAFWWDWDDDLASQRLQVQSQYRAPGRALRLPARGLGAADRTGRTGAAGGSGGRSPSRRRL